MCEDCKSRTEPIIKAAVAIGHIPTYIVKGMSDNYTCSCGWKSHVFWDGEEYALDEFIKHAQAEISRLEHKQQR